MVGQLSGRSVGRLGRQNRGFLGARRLMNPLMGSKSIERSLANLPPEEIHSCGCSCGYTCETRQSFVCSTNDCCVNENDGGVKGERLPHWSNCLLLEFDAAVHIRLPPWCCLSLLILILLLLVLHLPPASTTSSHSLLLLVLLSPRCSFAGAYCLGWWQRQRHSSGSYDAAA